MPRPNRRKHLLCGNSALGIGPHRIIHADHFLPQPLFHCPHSVTVKFAAIAGTPSTVITTGCTPASTVVGTMKFT